METGTTTDGVNLRAEPSTAAGVKILRLLVKGTQLTILDHDKAPWLHAQTADSIVGYVHGDYVNIQTVQSTSTAAPSQSTSATASPPQSGHAVAGGPQTAASTSSSQPVVESRPETSASHTVASSDIPDQSALYAYIASIPNNYAITQGYYDFQAQREKLGLPAPFDVPPTAYEPSKLPLNGFGPNTFALNNWSNWYTRVCGMHNGLDHNVPLGTPLLALSDAIIVGDRSQWPFMSSRYEKTLVIWCLLPDDGSGTRKLSNVLVAYGHMSNNTVVKKGDRVKAGQIIGYSGYPHNEDATSGKVIEQPGNAHLHMEVHLLSGDNNTPYSRNRNPGLLRAYKKPQPFDNNTPFNPFLFFSERMVKYQMHQAVTVGRTYPDANALARVAPPIRNWPPLDFFTVAYFQYPGVRYANIIWKAQNPPPWGKGVYGVSDALERIKTWDAFEPYPIPTSM